MSPELIAIIAVGITLGLGLASVLRNLKADINTKFADQESGFNRQIDLLREDMDRRFTEQNTNFSRQLAEQKADTARQFAEQKSNFDRQIDLLREDMDRRFTERKADTDRQFAAQKADMDSQFAAQAELTESLRYEIKTVTEGQSRIEGRVQGMIDVMSVRIER